MNNKISKSENNKDTKNTGNNKKTKKEEVSGFREIVESLIFALLLAFYIKTFEAEAFVIPTGSMAPTLKGRHKDVICDECHFRFQVNASEEINNTTNRSTSSMVVGGTCPQCGYTQFFNEKQPSFTGDRILVSKTTFDQREVKRWDVSVFRAPAEPKINFIKRIIGLPNEYIRIQYGDIFVEEKDPSGKADFEIKRKPLKQLLQTLQPVYDNDYPLSDEIYKLGWLRRWYDEITEMGQGTAWTPSSDGKTFTFSGKVQPLEIPAVPLKKLKTQSDILSIGNSGKEENIYWLCYRHIVPSSDDWLSLMENKLPQDVANSGIIQNNPQLITDMTAYNTGISIQSDEDSAAYSRFIRKMPALDTKGRLYQCRKSPDGFGFNWTGDLSLSCEVEFSEDQFTDQEDFFFELVKGGQNFRCQIHPLDGRISLLIPGIEGYIPETVTYPFVGKRKYRFQFINIDEQMRLVIDGKEVKFPNNGRYDHLCKPFSENQPGLLKRNRDPNIKDLRPVAVGSRNLNMSISHLNIMRDLYYIAMGNQMEPLPVSLQKKLYEIGNRRSDRLASEPISTFDEISYTQFLSTPERWTGYGNTWSALFSLDKDQYLALGDNSGLSHDSRLWSNDVVPYYIDRKFMIGKAFYVYWPHGKNIPGTKLPFIAEFKKMRHID